MNPCVQTARNLVVDLAAEPGQAAERCLDVAAGATEAVVEVEVAEGGIEVIHPRQADHAAAEPDAFGVAGRAVEHLGGFRKLGGLALIFLGGVGGGGIALALLVLGMVVAALGKRAAATEGDNECGDREMAQQGGL